MAKLTKRVVEAATPRDTDYFIWCGDLPGFGVRIFASGRRSYLAQYRAEGRSRRVTLGTHPVIQTEEARKAALALLGDVARGENPAEERVTRRAAITVAELCDRYLTAAEGGHVTGKGGRPKKPSTLDTDRGRIARHIKPLLGKRLVKDLAPADISKWIRDVSSGKTATTEKTGALRGKSIVEGGPGTAARTAGLLGGILTFAIGEGIIASNPVRGVKRPAGKRRTRRLSHDEFARLGAALAAAEAEGVAWQGIAAIRLLALTGARLSEIVEMKWSELDTGGSALRLDDSKEGASARPAGSAVFGVIEKLPRAAGDYLLPAARQGQGAYGNMPRIWKDIRERAGLDGVTAHTLRHTFGSVAGDLGYSESTIGAMLGHAAGTVTGRYVHHLDSVLLAAADKVADEIWRQMAAGLSTTQMRDR